MKVTAPRNQLLYVSNHAIERYQQRIENCPPTEVIRRLRKIVEPQRKAAPGCWSVTSGKCGPRCKVHFTINEDGSGAITSVYPVTDQQVTRALVDRTWV